MMRRLALISLLASSTGCNTTCDPQRNDNVMRVIQQCGEPIAVEAARTSYGAIRQELDYGKLIVVAEDGSVLSVLKVEEL